MDQGYTMLGFVVIVILYDSLIKMFWKQLEWISPESCLADGSDYLISVSRNKNLFHGAHQALRPRLPKIKRTSPGLSTRQGPATHFDIFKPVRFRHI